MPATTLKDLPIQLSGDKRSPANHVSVTPGFQGRAGFENCVNGAVGNYSELLVGGAEGSIFGGVPGAIFWSFSVEDVAEFKLADVPSADMGNTGGVAVSLVTKSGSNNLHGSAYEYLRNDALDSRDYFSPTVPKDKENEYGFTLGGPVYIPHVYNGKDRTFFFVNVGWYKHPYGAGAQIYAMPTEAFKQGNFSSVLGAQVGTDDLGRPVYRDEIYDPSTTRPVTAGQVDSVTGLTATATGTIRHPFAGDMIAQSKWSAVSSKYQAFYSPLPANAPLVNNYLTSGGAGLNNTGYYSIKFDQVVGQNRFSGFFYRNAMLSRNPFTLPAFFGHRIYDNPRVHDIRINWTRTFDPRLVNDFSAAVNREGETNNGTSQADNGAALIGQPNALGLCAPAVQMSGIFGRTFGDENCIYHTGNTNWRFHENLSYIRGRHFLKFEVNYYRINNNTPVPSNGLFNFNAAETALPGAFLSATGFPYAIFLLGEVDSSIVLGTIAQNIRGKEYGLYAQDSYRASSKLTLSLGLRWDVMPMLWDGQNRLSAFSPTVPNPGAGDILGALTFQGTGPGRIGGRYFSPTRYTNFGLKIGFAYEILPKTLVRANWGTYYGPVSTACWGCWPQQGFSPSFSRATLDGFIPPFDWDQGFPLPPNPNAPNITPSVANGSATSFYGHDAARPPRIQMVHFGIQRELPADAIALIKDYVKLCGVNALGYELEAELLFQQRQFGLAFTAAPRSSGLDDKNGRMHELLGLIYFANRQDADAVAELHKAAQSGPDQPQVRYFCGRALYSKGLYADARDRFLACLRIQPGYRKALENLGLCYEALQDFSNAREAYRKAMLLEETQTGPKHGEPSAFYGAMLIKLGMPEQALPVLRQAKGLSPRSFVVNYELGRVLLTLDHLDECDKFLLAAADLAPNFYRTYYLLGTLRQKQNRLAESRLYFAKLEELNKSAQNPEFPLTDR